MFFKPRTSPATTPGAGLDRLLQSRDARVAGQNADRLPILVEVRSEEFSRQIADSILWLRQSDDLIEDRPTLERHIDLKLNEIPKNEFLERSARIEAARRVVQGAFPPEISVAFSTIPASPQCDDEIQEGYIAIKIDRIPRFEAIES